MVLYNSDLPFSSTHAVDNTPSRASGMATSKIPKGKTQKTLQHIFVSSNRSIDTSQQSLLAASSSRCYLLIQNTGGLDILLGFGAFPTLDGANAIVLPPNTQIDFPSGYVPNNEIYAVCSGNGQVAILEGTKRYA